MYFYKSEHNTSRYDWYHSLETSDWEDPIFVRVRFANIFEHFSAIENGFFVLFNHHSSKDWHNLGEFCPADILSFLHRRNYDTCILQTFALIRRNNNNFLVHVKKSEKGFFWQEKNWNLWFCAEKNSQTTNKDYLPHRFRHKRSSEMSAFNRFLLVAESFPSL